MSLFSKIIRNITQPVVHAVETVVHKPLQGFAEVGLLPITVPANAVGSVVSANPSIANVPILGDVAKGVQSITPASMALVKAEAPSQQDTKNILIAGAEVGGALVTGGAAAGYNASVATQLATASLGAGLSKSLVTKPGKTLEQFTGNYIQNELGLGFNPFDIFGKPIPSQNPSVNLPASGDFFAPKVVEPSSVVDNGVPPELLLLILGLTVYYLVRRN